MIFNFEVILNHLHQLVKRILSRTFSCRRNDLRKNTLIWVLTRNFCNIKHNFQENEVEKIINH